MSTNSVGKTQTIRRSIEQWQHIMSAYESSGLTQELFCLQESIAPSTFYTWRQRLNGNKPAKPKSPQFVELTTSQQKPESVEWDIN